MLKDLRRRRMMRRAVIRRRIAGVLFLVLLAALPALAVAIYDKAFTHSIDVTLHTDSIGNQLRPTADVKERGVIVGSVRAVHSTGNGANVTLAIDPSYADQVPSNAVAQILPKTLLGQEFVNLAVPARPGHAIEAGDTLEQDHSAASLETQDVLSNLLPVLNAINPAQFNVTLTAMADTLRGHGYALGKLIVSLDHYVRALNAKTPQGDTYTQRFVTNLHKLARVADEYNKAIPDLGAGLKNLENTSKTLSARGPRLNQLFRSVVGTSNATGGFLNHIAAPLRTATSDSAQVLGLTSQYSSEFNCTFRAMSHVADLADGYMSGGEAHLSMQLDDKTSMGKYTPGQEPRLLNGYGPGCYGLPDHPSPQKNGHFIAPNKFVCMNDGAPLTDRCYREDPPTGGGA